MVETEAGLDVVVEETGENLGMIEGAGLDDMDLVVGDDPGEEERLLIVRDGEITSIELPWTIRGLTLLGTVDFVYAYVSDPNGGRPSVWRSENGTTWNDLGPVDVPGLSGENSLRFVGFADGRLGAWNTATPDEAWESVDGINWQQVEFGPLPDDLTTDPDSFYQPILRTTASLWVLDDGVGLWIDLGGEWVSLADLDLPQQTQVPLRLGLSGFGNTIYIVANEFVLFGIDGVDGGFSTDSLWIVNLEPTE
jgi:hypothetical protein